MPEFPAQKFAPHPGKTAEREQVAARPPHAAPWAELAVTTNFSFLRGASHPEEFVRAAAAAGHRAAAIADRNSLAGVVRAHIAAKEAGLPLAVGARLTLSARERARTAGHANGAAAHTPPELCLYATDRRSYGRLSRLLTLGKLRGPKGSFQLDLDDLAQHAEGLLAVVLPPEPGPGRPASAPLDAAYLAATRELRGVFDDDRLSLAVTRLAGPDDRALGRAIHALGAELDVPLLATFDAHAHAAERRALQDVVTCIRHGLSLDRAGLALFPNGERRLVAPEDALARFADAPALLARAADVALRASAFSLDELEYRYPSEVNDSADDAQQHLMDLTWEGARERYPGGVPNAVRTRIEHEFALIAELRYAPYFLTVHDLVRFARQRGILCQGRGAAANSAVCYCLGVTSVDPDRVDLLFERFLSKERGEPPDIDIDFEHERREEVIQYVYQRYGRLRAALTGVIVSYRGRSAIREVGKALGFSLDLVDRLAKDIDWWHDALGSNGTPGRDEKLRQAGLAPDAPEVKRYMRLASELLGFPRHLGQHVGGFVITEDPLCELVPIENAAMPDRTVIEWDKDDIDALGILKVDLLGLGMLTAIRKSFALIESVGDDGAQREGGRFDVPTAGFALHTIPAEDPAVYDMISAADTVGVFQIESRAQMSMLPRLRPREFYDLVIEVAIVRPGPIQGDMVHPYLRRRNGEEPVSYPSEGVRKVLEKTLGVPLFQEQAMALAVVAAGFTPGEADKLRRAMAAWKRKGDQMKRFGEKLIDGMLDNGYDLEFAERIFKQLEGFSEYGFPESHAASFALLVYVSSWLKLYHPAAFCGALINSQPMGFYAPAQLVRDAEAHGVLVREIDVNHSGWDCRLERVAPDAARPNRADGPALRLGMRLVKGLRELDARAVERAIARHGPLTKLADLHALSGVPAKRLKPLAYADAFRSLGLARQEALWAVRGLRDEGPSLFADLREVDEGAGAEALPEVPPLQQVVHDYASHQLSLKAHPISFLRPELERRGAVRAAELADPRKFAQDQRVKVAGLVLVRQRPATAQGIIFMTLEDESGITNLVVHPSTFERHRAEARHGVALFVEGKVDRSDAVVHVVVQRFESLDERARALASVSRDFH
ncbi:MAG: error-prone DNA polymerase [Planctomycetota bacterium]